MKARTRLVLIILVILGALATKTAFGKEVSLVKTKNKNLFVLRVNKDYDGATVEVFYASGEVVLSQKLKKKKVIIDFCNSKTGAYTIRVVKGDMRKEFQYEKI
jgi:hypothetical protein